MPTFLDVKNLLKAKLQEGLEVVVANTALNYFESRITEQKDIQGNIMVLQYHYFEYKLNNKQFTISIRELKTGEYILYSITDKKNS